jgi:hypothetical protein
LTRTRREKQPQPSDLHPSWFLLLLWLAVAASAATLYATGNAY